MTKLETRACLSFLWAGWCGAESYTVAQSGPLPSTIYVEFCLFPKKSSAKVADSDPLKARDVDVGSNGEKS